MQRVVFSGRNRIARALTAAAFLLVFLSANQTRASSSPRYPANFLWGVAWSAHQTEGLTGGGEHGDWWRFEHPTASSRDGWRSPIRNGDTADVATDHWNRYPEDLRLAASLGVNTVRTSIAWEKIEPREGVFRREALEHYRAELQLMHELGLKPMIALHHFTHPQWFQDKGGWLNPESARFFARYARYMVEGLGDLCEIWITFNEPMVLVIMGYLKAEIPPLRKSLDDSFIAAYHLARAHRMAASIIHEVQGHSPGARAADGTLRGVGLANSFQYYAPETPGNADDQRAADTLAELQNWAFLRAMQSDRLKFEIPAEVPGAKSFEKKFPAADLPLHELGPFMDWIGVNYYTTYLIRYDRRNSLRAVWVNPPGPQGDNGWAIQPDGLEHVLRQTAKHFPGVPLVVSEQGMADARDDRRPRAIRDHLAALDRVMRPSQDSDTPAAGASPALDVRGYYQWTLTDNFEWLEGYSQRFGLFEIRYDDDLKRIERPSAEVFRQSIRARSGSE